MFHPFLIYFRIYEPMKFIMNIHKTRENESLGEEAYNNF